MKPIHLNLAARPYRDYRPVYAVVVVLSLLTAFLMLRNIETRYRYAHETSSTSKKIADLEAQTRQETQKEQVAQGRLRTLDLALLDEQTRFINTKLVERAFSWSTLLDELESILADDVRLLSIAPTFNDDGTIGLSLAFQSKSTQGMTTTIDRMHRDPQFSEPFPHNESLSDGIYSFNITVVYRPPALRGAGPVRASNPPLSGGKRVIP